MNELTWNYELAHGAQLWANQCKFEHDNAATCTYKYIGQNLYSAQFRGTPSDPKGNWNDAVDGWYNEVNNGIIFYNIILSFKYNVTKVAFKYQS